MINITLTTRDGAIVGYSQIPPFQLLPEMVMWGERFFVLQNVDKYRGPNRQTFALPVVYIEGLLFALLGDVALASV